VVHAGDERNGRRTTDPSGAASAGSMAPARPARLASRRRGPLALAIVVLAALLAAGCAGESADPDAEIRALIDAGELAAEARDLDAIMALVSGEYADADGRTRRDLSLYVRGLLALHPRLELFVGVESVELQGPEHARAVIRVASVGQRSAAGGGLAAADRRVELGLRRDGGEWRVVAARWSARGP